MSYENALIKGLVIDYLKEFEYFSFGKTDGKRYIDLNLHRA